MRFAKCAGIKFRLRGLLTHIPATQMILVVPVAEAISSQQSDMEFSKLTT